GVAELAALVDRAGRLRRRVARDPAREGELAEQPAEAVLVETDLRIDLAVGALEIGVGDDPWAAVPRAGDVDRVQLALPDRAVQVRIEQVQARSRPEVPEQPWLHVLRPERLVQERIVEKLDLADRQVV